MRRSHPRNAGSEGRPVRPRRQRRARRHRRGDRRGVPVCSPARSSRATTRRCCTPSSAGSTAPASPPARRWRSTDVPAGARAAARRPHSALAHLRGFERGDDHRRDPGQRRRPVRQVGIKIWVDGSPWIGNIDLSFPYLDTDADPHASACVPGSCGHANYTREQLTEIVDTYFPKGWPMACHVQGDAGVDTILDMYEEASARASARRPPTAARARRRDTRRAAAAGARSRRHVQHLRRPDPLLG